MTSLQTYIRSLAASGLGWEDILVKLRLRRVIVSEADVKRIMGMPP
jgi:hypothetical protein